MELSVSDADAILDKKEYIEEEPVPEDKFVLDSTAECLCKYGAVINYFYDTDPSIILILKEK